MSFLERFPRFSLTLIVLLLSIGVLASLEFAARHFFGLGNPVVYFSHPLYGYRPVANQTLSRFQSTHLHFNNLALRAQNDWDSETTHKILFLGDSVTYGGSYIANSELFSTLIGNSLPEFEVGNAGVNAWGVENVCALVQDTHFLPAQYYVSTFPEGDFLRGLNRFGGQPFWPRTPRWALEELYYYLLYKLSNHKYDRPQQSLTPQEERLVIQHAAHRLKNLDDFLKSQGYHHIIFITPSKQQALKQEPKHPDVENALKNVGLNAIYLLDLIPETESNTIESWFYDNIHLTQKGHAQWAEWMLPHIQNTL